MSGTTLRKASLQGARKSKWSAFWTRWYSGGVGSASRTASAYSGVGRMWSSSARQSWMGMARIVQPAGPKVKPSAGAATTAA